MRRAAIIGGILAALALVLAASISGRSTATAQLAYLDRSTDKVGSGSQATPDGRPDGHFQVTVDANDTVTAIDLRTSDSSGKACCGQVWNTVPRDAWWILGVFRNGTQLNPVDENISDPVSGSATYDLYATDSGYFRTGQSFVIAVSLASGACLSAVTTIGGSSTAGPACTATSTPSQPFPVASGTVTGTVTVQLPGSSGFVPLASGTPIPNGTVIDATKGTVTIPAPGGSDVFSKGIFSVFSTFETPKGKPHRQIVELRLTKENFKICGKRKTSSAGAKPTRKKANTTAVDTLWGKGSGAFRTKGRYAAATVRGTWWLTQDRCDGTFVRVRQGVVEVRDLVRKRTVLVRTGKSYLARKR